MNTLYHTPLRGVTLEDIPEEYRDIAETVGLEAYLTLSVLCGGQNLYIPKREALERQARNREIRAHFNGGNYRALAAQYRLSERQIRKIIHLAY
ncbi:Uncharacterized conserved protein [uncultured Flavonifractor sp.]|nr:Uncharacterized conserved protein [uncultured Flavonifractor sp.]